MNPFTIRDARPADAEQLLEIYAYYVNHTAVSFEYQPPSLAEFQDRIERTLPHYPYLVAETGGVICGYAYAGPFVGRAACNWSCETSIYLDRTMRKMGAGRALYDALADRLREMGIVNLYACIACSDVPDEYLDRNSPEFHAHMGFKEVGVFRNCGCKFGRWYHLIWMEKALGPHIPNPPAVNPPQNRPQGDNPTFP